MSSTPPATALKPGRLRSALSNGPARGLLAGGGLLFASTTLVNGGNYLFNLLLGRWLGPDDFADLSLIVTLLLVISFATTTLSMVAAKFTAIHEAGNDIARIATVRRWLTVRAWTIGIALGIALSLGSPWLHRFFNTRGALPFIIFGLGAPFFVVQGVDRGVLQGRTRFVVLAMSYQAEMWVRLLAGVALVGAGLSVNWAVGAIAASFVATWAVARRAGSGLMSAGSLPASERAAIVAFSLPVIAGLVGQILINNSDVLIVKHFFDRTDAGQYAALALVGRIVFFATWSIVTVTFPIVAQRQQRGEGHRQFLWLSIAIVLAGSAVILTAMVTAPDLIVRVLFGADYLRIAPLLWLYAVATTLYALANVGVTYQLSAGRGLGSWLALAAGGIQVLTLTLIHGSLRQVVVAQIVVMGIFTIGVFMWNFLIFRGSEHS